MADHAGIKISPPAAAVQQVQARVKRKGTVKQREEIAAAALLVLFTPKAEEIAEQDCAEAMVLLSTTLPAKKRAKKQVTFAQKMVGRK